MEKEYFSLAKIKISDTLSNGALVLQNQNRVECLSVFNNEFFNIIIFGLMPTIAYRFRIYACC